MIIRFNKDSFFYPSHHGVSLVSRSQLRRCKSKLKYFRIPQYAVCHKALLRQFSTTLSSTFHLKVIIK